MSVPLRSASRALTNESRHQRALAAFEQSLPNIASRSTDVATFHLQLIIESGIDAMELLQFGLKKIARRSGRLLPGSERHLDESVTAKAILEGSSPLADLPGDADVWARALEELQEQKRMSV
jgi:hypothetical protein